MNSYFKNLLELEASKFQYFWGSISTRKREETGHALYRGVPDKLTGIIAVQVQYCVEVTKIVPFHFCCGSAKIADHFGRFYWLLSLQYLYEILSQFGIYLCSYVAILGDFSFWYLFWTVTAFVPSVGLCQVLPTAYKVGFGHPPLSLLTILFKLRCYFAYRNKIETIDQV